MFQLILGKPRSGKTFCMQQQILESAKAGKAVLLIVPEQFSFESERTLSSMMDETSFSHVEVLSFTSLCNRIFRQFGGLAGNYLSKGGKYILMDLAIDQMKETMQVYMKQAGTAAFTQSMCETITQLKSAGITADDLIQKSSLLEDTLLTAKTNEIAEIYEMYEALIARGYADPDDDLTRATDLIHCSDFFEHTHLYFDAFDRFSQQEYQMIHEIMAQCDKICFAICDDPEDQSNQAELFAMSRSTASHLTAMAKEAGQVHKPNVCCSYLVDQKEELVQITDQMFANQIDGWHGIPTAVSALCAQNPYHEMEIVASEIMRLVREEGYRYRDILLVGRQVSAYDPAVRAAFLKRGIPVLLDERRRIDIKPLFQLCLSILKIGCSGFETEQLLRMLKTGLIGIPTNEIAQLENYAYIWNLRSSAWQKEFVSHPEGFGKELTEEDEAILEMLNQIRCALVTPLERFRMGISRQSTGEEYAKALYRILCDYEVAVHMEEQAKQYEAADQTDLQAEYGATWDILIEILDQLAFTLKGVEMKCDRFYSLFQMVLAQYDAGVIPQTLDQVMLGEAGHVRVSGCKAVFLIGANEGVFPASDPEISLFTEDDYVKLEGVGLSVAESGANQILSEYYYAYFAAARAQERLYFSYSQADFAEKALLPSVLIEQYQRIFSNGQIKQGKDFDPMFFVSNARTALDVFAKRAAQTDAVTQALREYLETTSYADAAKRCEQEKTEQRLSIRADYAKKLYGRRLYLSPTKIEKFYRCKFAYFCAEGMKIRKRMRAELSPIETGSIIHYALQQLIARHADMSLSEIDPKQLQREIEQILTEYMEQFMGGMADKTARFKYLYRRLKKTVLRLIEQLAREFDQSKFTPCDFELSIGDEQEIKPLEVRLMDGSAARVYGQIDRVDVYKEKGRSYIRVIDYKSGNKVFKLSDVYYGMNLQMLIYLFTIWQNGKQKYADVYPAGVLYLPANDPSLSVDYSQSEDQIESARGAQLKMSGIILDDPEVIEAMEQDGKGIFIPVKLKKDGTPDAASSLATLAQMGDLKRHIEKMIGDMTQELLQGKIDILPAEVPGGYDLCSYCEYKRVCGIDDGFERRTLEQLDKNEVLSKIHEEDALWQENTQQNN